MALGKRRRERQLEAFVVASDLPRCRDHPFCTALNRLLVANRFEVLVENPCAPFYAETMGRPAGRLLPDGHMMMVTPRNLTTIAREIIGVGGPRSLQALRTFLQIAGIHFERLLSGLDRLVAA